VVRISIALTVAAGGHDLIDVTGDLAQYGGRRDRRFCNHLADEFVSAGRELSGPGSELGEAVGEVFRVEAAVLECGQVPVDRRAGPGLFPLSRRQLGLPALVSGGVARARVGDQVVLVPVEIGQRAGNGLFGGVGADALAAAGGQEKQPESRMALPLTAESAVGAETAPFAASAGEIFRGKSPPLAWRTGRHRLPGPLQTGACAAQIRVATDHSPCGHNAADDEPMPADGSVPVRRAGGRVQAHAARPDRVRLPCLNDPQHGLPGRVATGSH